MRQILFCAQRQVASCSTCLLPIVLAYIHTSLNVQVYNALGFAYFNMERNELAQSAYRQAVDLQPGYVTAWNNLGDACEKVRDFEAAYKAYKEALAYAPDNKVAQSRADALKNRVAA